MSQMETPAEEIPSETVVTGSTPTLQEFVPAAHLYPYHVLLGGWLVVYTMLATIYVTATPAVSTPIISAATHAAIAVSITVLFDKVASTAE